MDNRSLIIVVLIVIAIILGGIAIGIGNSLTQPQDDDTSGYGTTVPPTTTAPPTTVPPTTVPPTTIPPTTVTPSIVDTDTPTPTVTVSPTIPETALISDEADRLILGTILIIGGFLAMRFEVLARSIELYHLVSTNISTAFVTRKEESLSKERRSFEEQMKDQE